jgi:hypothetical protein
MTKTSRISASNPHVGIVGHITKQELSELLSRVDIFNGFANRFLWWCARRSKSLPLARGMEAPTVDRLATEYAQRLHAAKQLEEVEFSEEARKLYVALYDDITEERSGMHAIVTSRAETQVIRLALTYALIDASPLITTAHLTAAIAAWDYCDDSAAYLFGHSDRNPLENRIVEALASGPLTTTELHQAFGNHTQGEALRGALEILEARGELERITAATGGRPCVTWCLRTGFKRANEAKKAN